MWLFCLILHGHIWYCFNGLINLFSPNFLDTPGSVLATTKKSFTFVEWWNTLHDNLRFIYLSADPKIKLYLPTQSILMAHVQETFYIFLHSLQTFQPNLNTGINSVTHCPSIKTKLSGQRKKVSNLIMFVWANKLEYFESNSTLKYSFLINTLFLPDSLVLATTISFISHCNINLLQSM